MRMNKIDEAVEAALKLTDASKIYGIAQIARPINLSATFTLAIASMAKEWNSWNPERAQWIIDLANVEKMLPELLDKFGKTIKSKDTQFHMIKFLYKKGNVLESFSLAKNALTQFSKDELLIILNDLVERGYKSMPLKPGTTEEDTNLNRTQLLQILPECKVPQTLPNWLWKESINAYNKAFDQKTLKESSKNAIIEGIDFTGILNDLDKSSNDNLDCILERVDDIEQLTILMKSCVSYEAYSEVNRIGSYCLDLIISQQKEDNKFKENKIALEFKYKQLVAEGNTTESFEPPIADYIEYNYERKKQDVCSIMLNAALKHKEHFKQEALKMAQAASNDQSSSSSTLGGPSEPTPMITEESPEEIAKRQKKIDECSKVLAHVTEIAIKKISNPEDLLQSSKNMSVRGEYRLSLKIAHTAFNQVSELVQQRKELDKKFEIFSQKQQEINLLLSQKIKLTPEQIEEYRKLSLEKEKEILLPDFVQKTETQFIRQWFLIAQQILRTALQSKLSDDNDEKMNDNEIQNEIEAVFKYVKHPNNMKSLVELFWNQKEYTLIHFIGEKSYESIKNIYDLFLKRIPIEIEIQELIQESNQNNTSKELPEQQKKRLDELKLQLDNLPERSYYELNTAEAYEQSLWEILSKRIGSALEHKKYLESQITFLSTSIDNKDERINELNIELTNINTLIPNLLEKIISQTDSPFHLYELMNLLKDSQLSEIPKIAGRSFAIIDNLYEDCKSKILPSYEKLQLQNQKVVNNNLPPKERKPLPTEDIDKLRLLELNEKINEISLPQYKRLNATQLSNLMKKTVVLLISSIQSKQTLIYDEIHSVRTREIQSRNDLENNSSSLSETDILVQKTSIESLSKKFKELSNEIQILTSTMNDAVEQIVSRVSSPDTLNAVAYLLKSPIIDTYEIDENKQNLKHKKRLYLQIPPIVKQLDKIRSERIDTYYEKELLSTEQRNLSAMLKFPDDKLQKLKELEKQIYIWNSDVSYKNLKANDYDKIIFESCSNALVSLYNEYNTLQTQLDQLNNQQETAESVALNNKSTNQSTDGDVDMSESLDPKLLADFERRRKTITSHILIISDEIKSVIDSTLLFVKNPNYLSNITRKLIPFSKYALDNIIKLCENIFIVCDELKKIAKEREPILDELESLENEQSELEDVKKSLQGDKLKRLEELRHKKHHWDSNPSYTSTDEKEINEWNFMASNLMIDTILTQKVNLTAKLNEIKIKNLLPSDSTTNTSSSGGAIISNVDEIEKLQQDIEELSKKSNEILHKSMSNLDNPSHYEQLVNLVFTKGEHDLVFTISKENQEKITKHDNYRQQLCTLARKIFLLQIEEYIKQENREPLDDKRVKQREKYEKEFESLPDLLYGVDWNISTEARIKGLPKSSTLAVPLDSSKSYFTEILDQHRQESFRMILTSILTKQKNYNDQIENEENLGIEHSKIEIEQKRKEINDEINEIVNYCLSHISNPQHIYQMYSVAKSFDKHELSIHLGEKYIRLVADLRKNQEDKKPILAQKEKLEILEKDLKSQRKSLSDSDAEKLRDLKFDYDLDQIQPKYSRKTVLSYDLDIWRMFSEMLRLSLEHKQQVDNELDIISKTPHLVRGKSSWTADQVNDYISSTRTSTTNELENLIQLASEFITNVDHLTTACESLNGYKQFIELIQMGKHAQGLLKDMVMKRIIYEETIKELEEEKEKLPPSVMENERTKELQDELDALSLEVSDKSQHHLRSMILKIADLMIDAARTEKMQDVVRDEAILVFKMTLTVAKFEEVKTLVGDKDWDAIRKQLLDYVVNYNATLPGSAITLSAQMELLLRENLWKEATRLLPEPPLPSAHDYSSTSKAYISMLELLWFEIERIDSNGLNKLLAFIEDFAKKEFQQQRIDTMDRLLDGVQTSFPDFIIDLYKSASDLILSTLQGNQKQYKLYCNFASIAKRRFMDMGKKAEWKAFIAEIRSVNARKRNLIKQLDVNDLK